MVSDGIGNTEKACISKHFLASGVTCRCRIGSTPNCQFLSSMFFDKEKHNTFKNEEFLKFRKWHLWNGKLFQVAKILSRNRDK